MPLRSHNSVGWGRYCLFIEGLYYDPATEQGGMGLIGPQVKKWGKTVTAGHAMSSGLTVLLHITASSQLWDLLQVHLRLINLKYRANHVRLQCIIVHSFLLRLMNLKYQSCRYTVLLYTHQFLLCLINLKYQSCRYCIIVHSFLLCLMNLKYQSGMSLLYYCTNSFLLCLINLKYQSCRYCVIVLTHSYCTNI